jgi:hypothetical protein
MYSGLFAAALIALILTVVAVFFLGKRGPWGSIWTFFLVLFLTLCTVSIYVAPIGPVYWGVAWIPITIAGIIATILLIAAMPHPHADRDEVHVGKNTTDVPATPAGRFFWVLIILVIIAIVVGMLNPQSAL